METCLCTTTTPPPPPPPPPPLRCPCLCRREVKPPARDLGPPALELLGRALAVWQRPPSDPARILHLLDPGPEAPGPDPPRALSAGLLLLQVALRQGSHPISEGADLARLAVLLPSALSRAGVPQATGLLQALAATHPHRSPSPSAPAPGPSPGRLPCALWPALLCSVSKALFDATQCERGPGLPHAAATALGMFAAVHAADPVAAAGAAPLLVPVLEVLGAQHLQPPEPPAPPSAPSSAPASSAPSAPLIARAHPKSAPASAGTAPDASVRAAPPLPPPAALPAAVVRRGVTAPLRPAAPQKGTHGDEPLCQCLTLCRTALPSPDARGHWDGAYLAALGRCVRLQPP